MTDRIISKLDELLSKNDYEGAEKHLLYWLNETEKSKDRRTALLICNELMGLCRKLGRKDDALTYSSLALKEINAMGISENIGAATTYINTATVYKAFGMADKSMPLFEKAREIYEQKLTSDDPRLGGLYNNMALALVDNGSFEEAFGYYDKALKVMKRTENGKPEQAVTYLNMASAAEAQKGLESAASEINYYLDKAAHLLDESISTSDGNYAFVCEKCAPVFGYYGYFLYEKELRKRSRRIYERS